MTPVEFGQWADYFRLYPFDDMHRYHRPAALVSVSMAGGEINDRLDWLQAPPAAAKLSDADKNTLKALGIKRPEGR